MSYSVIQRANGVFYYRKRVPKDLVSKIGKQEIIKSLKVKSKSNLFKILPRVELEVQDYFLNLRLGKQVTANENAIIFNDKVKDNKTLTYIFDKWLAQNKPSPSSIAEWKFTINQFTEIFGNIPIKEIQSKHIIEFKEIISKVPARYSLKYPNKKLTEIYKEFKKKENYELPAIQTISKRISALKSLLNVALNEGIISQNPALVIKLKGIRNKGLRRGVFTKEQLNLIFNPELEKQNNSKFWIPYIALYSGMRLEEIGQLSLSDIKQEAGIYYFDVNDSEDKNLKTKTSIRKIPIHQKILDKNFLNFVETSRNLIDNKGKLFSELKASKNGKLTKEFSRWFARYLEKIGISDKSLVFHSFRHGFKGACRNSEIPEEISDALTGHSSTSIGRTYGNGFSIEILNKWLQKVEV